MPSPLLTRPTLCLILGSPLISQNPAGPSPGIELSWHSEHPRYYRGEVLRLELRIACPKPLRRESLLQPFRRALALPVRLLTGDSKILPGCRSLPVTPATARDGADCAVDGERRYLRRLSDEQRDGRVWEVFALERHFALIQAGALRIPAARLDYLYTSNFRNDAFRGRIPTDRRLGKAAAPALILEVRDLPQKGRPPAFQGAVGEFRIKARANPTELRPGESLHLELEIEGEGDLQGFPAPDLRTLPGFHLRGRSEQVQGPVRRIRYELLLQDPDVTSVPEIPFAFFRPRPTPGYLRLRSAAIPLRVLGGGTRPTAADSDPGGLRPLKDLEGPGLRRPGVQSDLQLQLVLFTPWLGLLVGGLWWQQRRRRDPAQHRARTAASRALARLGTADPGPVLRSYLADRLRLTEAAVAGPDLPQLLGAAGADPATARACAQLLLELLAPRFQPTGPGREDPAAAGKCREMIRVIEPALSRAKTP